MYKFGNIEVLPGECNSSTITDGRGGIFTWIPKEAILEFNLLYFLPSKVRGNHYHPEFDEYLLVVAGTGVLLTRNPDDGSDMVMQMSEGMCVHIPKNTLHAFQAVLETTVVSLITKPWDECDPPMVFERISSTK